MLCIGGSRSLSVSSVWTNLYRYPYVMDDSIFSVAPSRWFSKILKKYGNLIYRKILEYVIIIQWFIDNNCKSMYSLICMASIYLFLSSDSKKKKKFVITRGVEIRAYYIFSFTWILIKIGSFYSLCALKKTIAIYIICIVRMDTVWKLVHQMRIYSPSWCQH